MSAEGLESVKAELEPEAEKAGREENLEASVLTSADTKLAYNEDEGRFEAIIVGDINAFPEGLLKQSDFQDEDITGHVAEALTKNMEGEIVVNLPEYVFAGDEGLVEAGELPEPDDEDFSEELRDMGLDEEWLIEEKLNLAEGKEYGDSNLSGIPDVAGVEKVHLTYGGRGIESTERGELIYNGKPVAGCINISDRGENLTDRIENPDAFSRIVNSPTAVWNSDLEETQKVSLMEKAGSVAEGFDRSQTVESVRVKDKDEIYEFVRTKFDDGESAVLKTDPMGSWGDSIVVFDYEEFERMKLERSLWADYIPNTLMDDAKGQDSLESYVNFMIKNESARISQKSNRPEVQLVGEDGFYSRGEVGYGVMEHAADGKTEIDGDTYHIIDKDGEPIDFVPLLVSNEEPEVVSYFVRVSEGDKNLNVNRGSDKFDVKSLERFYEGNEELFEEVAEEEVELEELENALDEAAYVAYLARNLTAYDAERGLS
jgi:hypothetical protein